MSIQRNNQLLYIIYIILSIAMRSKGPVYIADQGAVRINSIDIEMVGFARLKIPEIHTVTGHQLGIKHPGRIIAIQPVIYL